MKLKKIEPFYVITWDTNAKKVKYYDIMPYLVDCFKRTKKSKREVTPETFDDVKEYILKEAQYQFWARCEYEVIVSAWPPHPRKNEDGTIKMVDYNLYIPEKTTVQTIDFYDQKIDVFEQIKANIDVITNHFMKYI